VAGVRMDRSPSQSSKSTGCDRWACGWRSSITGLTHSNGVILMHAQVQRFYFILILILLAPVSLRAAEPAWLQATAYAVPKETSNQGSGYFSIVGGLDGKLY